MSLVGILDQRLAHKLSSPYNNAAAMLPYREAIKSIRHGNELLKSDLAWEARESRFITNPSAAAEIQRLQDQADIYAKKTEQVRSQKPNGINRCCARQWYS